MSVNINSSPQSQLVINKMTNDTFNKLKNGQISGKTIQDNELYFITDDRGVTITDLLPSSTIGSATQPIYWDGDSFEPITSYQGNSATTTGANLTTTTNAIAKYSNTTGTFANSGVTLYGDSFDKIKVNEICLNRTGSQSYGRISWYSTNYKTWYTYMSTTSAGVAPTGGKPSSLGTVTTYALRSLIQNNNTYGWLWEAAPETAAESTSTTPTPRMSLSSATGQLYVAANVNSNTTLSSSLILSSKENGNRGNVGLELWRDTNSSWQIINDGGKLSFKNNWTTAAQSTYSQQSLILDYNTGAGSIPYFTVGQTTTNTNYPLYVNGISRSTSYNVADHVSLEYDSTNEALNFVFS